MPYLQILNPWPPHPCGDGDKETGDYIRIPFEIIRSARKTMALQFAPDGRLVLRLPRRLPEREALDFARRHVDWIGKNYRKVMELKREQPVYGEEEIRSHTKELRPVLMHRVSYYAALLGVDYGRIAIRNQRTRWGSCSSAGNLNFNWRLALLPEELLDYVVVHELAHRLEMNHSARFWMHVGRILPDYKERRRRLKEYRI